jgi:ethanolamine transporter EutH
MHFLLIYLSIVILIAAVVIQHLLSENEDNTPVPPFQAFGKMIAVIFFVLLAPVSVVSILTGWGILKIKEKLDEPEEKGDA